MTIANFLPNIRNAAIMNAVLIPFWWLTIISNIFSIIAEFRRKKEIN